MVTGNLRGNPIEDIKIPKALTPQENPDSYTYSFHPILTNEIFQSMGNPYFFQEIVSFGGGLQHSLEKTTDSSGQESTQQSSAITLKITKKTPRSLVEKAFSTANATGKIKINLTTESYS